MTLTSSSSESAICGDILRGSSASDPLASRARERLREAQNMLASLGYAISHHRNGSAAVDGVFGNNTRQAIRQFQADQAMDTKGQLDDETWETLSEAFAEARDVAVANPDGQDSQAATDADSLLSQGVHQTAAELVAELADEPAEGPTNGDPPGDGPPTSPGP